MTGHPPDGARGPGVKLYNQSYQSNPVGEIEWRKFSPGGPVISCCPGRDTGRSPGPGGLVERVGVCWYLFSNLY